MALRSGLAPETVELVALTNDEAFLHTLHEAVGPARRVWHVPSADKLSDLLIGGRVGILILDARVMQGGLSRFVAQIKRQFPDLVLLVAGTHEDESTIAAALGAGTVSRFIHKPLSPARAKLFVETAIKRYAESHHASAFANAARRVGKVRRTWLVPAGIASLVALGSAIILLHRSGSDENRELKNRPAAADSILLGRAAEALAANRLTEPSGDNALDLYLEQLVREPGDALARAGIAEVHERLLARAENALLEERLDEAQQAIETARRAGVERGRIAFLTAQLGKSREQVKLAQSRVRTQSRREPVSSGRLPKVASTGATQVPADGALNAPTAARDRAQVQGSERLLTLANERLQQDRLVEPLDDSAKYYLSKLRALDPKFAGLTSASRDMLDRLLTKARRAASLEQYDAARTWLGEAVAFGPDSVEAASIRAQIDVATSASKPLEAPADAARAPASAGGRASTKSAATLTIISKVTPVYPREANLRNIAGWVDLEFTVTRDGRVKNISVTNAQPRGLFNKAATDAVSRWRFAPVMQEGQPIELRTGLRVRFANPD